MQPKLIHLADRRRPGLEERVQPRLLLGQHLEQRRRVHQILLQLRGHRGHRVQGGRRVGQERLELLLKGHELLRERGAGGHDGAQVRGPAPQGRGQVADQLVQIPTRDGPQEPGGGVDHLPHVGRDLVGRHRHAGPGLQRRGRTAMGRNQVDDLLTEIVGDLDGGADVARHLGARMDVHGDPGAVRGESNGAHRAHRHPVQLDGEVLVQP
jgi:hypothetical protein